MIYSIFSIGLYTLELARIAHGADPSARALLMLTMGITAIAVMVSPMNINNLLHHTHVPNTCRLFMAHKLPVTHT